MSLYAPSESLVLKLTEWAIRCVESDDERFLEYVQHAEDRRDERKPVKKDRRKTISLAHLASRFVKLEEDDGDSGHCA